jgi:uncharacterized protein
MLTRMQTRREARRDPDQSDVTAMLRVLQPTQIAQRIQSLDVLRGFALLGILLLNILSFGLYSAAYANPGFDLIDGNPVDVVAWAVIEVAAEGAMRCLFAILFGAGVLLFATGPRAKGGDKHYKRNFWLLVFGLIDGYLLLWNGDILLTYAHAGFALYLVRNQSARRFLAMAVTLILLISLLNAGLGMLMREGRDGQALIAVTEDPSTLPRSVTANAAIWHDFSKDFAYDESDVQAEFSARRTSYATAFAWNAGKNTEVVATIVPTFLLWDALAMMLLGMAVCRCFRAYSHRAPAFRS